MTNIKLKLKYCETIKKERKEKKYGKQKSKRDTGYLKIKANGMAVWDFDELILFTKYEAAEK